MKLKCILINTFADLLRKFVRHKLSSGSNKHLTIQFAQTSDLYVVK